MISDVLRRPREGDLALEVERKHRDFNALRLNFWIMKMLLCNVGLLCGKWRSQLWCVQKMMHLFQTPWTSAWLHCSSDRPSSVFFHQLMCSSLKCTCPLKKEIRNFILFKVCPCVEEQFYWSSLHSCRFNHTWLSQESWPQQNDSLIKILYYHMTRWK